MSVSERPWEKWHRELGVSFQPESELTLAQHVAQKAQSIPDQTALVYLRKEISFAEVEAEAGKLANALVSIGIRPGEVIGIHLPNIPQFCFALVAASKLGCIVSGVSPLLAPPETAHQIADAGISTLISMTPLAARAFSKAPPAQCLKRLVTTGAADFLASPEVSDPLDVPGIDVYAYQDLIKDADPVLEPVDSSADDIFLYQYTGGTTGPAKGAMLTHRSLVNNGLQAFVFKPMLDDAETNASAAPLFHMAGLGCLAYGLRIGAKQSVIPDPRDMKQFCQFMVDHPPTWMNGAPALYQMLTEEPMSQEVDFSNLKVAVVGAAPLTSAGRIAIESLIGEGKLGDVFGMTETGPIYVANPASRLKPDAVGIPLPGMDILIVDVETGEKEMPVGEPGEIIVSTPHMMRGYLNMPEETAKTIRDHGERTYLHSGDVGFFDEEGYLHICDRAKDMLIVGGYKVFSVEVEDKLAGLDVVSKSAVIGTPDEKRPGNDIVNLYVELAPAAKHQGEDDIRSEILAFFKSNMAPYKTPKAIHFLKQMPLTPVGKIDKKALRAT